MHRTTVIATLFTIPTLFACSAGTAHIVRGDRHGGEVALDGPYMDSVASARLQMAEHCRGQFTIQDPDDPRRAVIAPEPGERSATFVCVSHERHASRETGGAEPANSVSREREPAPEPEAPEEIAVGPGIE